MKNIVMMPISDVHPYPNNPRVNKEAVSKVAASLNEFGFRQPIVVDKDNVIIVGHTRLQAARQLGFTEVPVLIADDLSEEQVRAYRLADNKTAEFAEWDFDKLDEELSGILDIDMTDFGFEFEFNDNKEDLIITEDETPENIETRCRTGDIWILGKHRLICGDSTDISVIEKLMDDNKANIAITSPPYNANHLDIPKSDKRGGGKQKSSEKKYLLDNDHKTDEEYFSFLCSNIDILLLYSDEIFYNLGICAGNKSTLSLLLNHYSKNFKDLIYWIKDNPMPLTLDSVISSATELIICLGKNGSRSFNYFTDRLFHGVITGHSAALSNEYADVHKATFPVYLPFEIISRFTPDHGSVLDCFGGTGTTMIACEQLDRCCYMCELDEHYCDIIISRWENFTGEHAVRMNGDD